MTARPWPSLDTTPRLWLHREDKTAAELGLLRGIVTSQCRLALQGTPPSCAVCFRLPPSWLYTYRCRRCGLWLCPACATDHFATTTTEG